MKTISFLAIYMFTICLPLSGLQADDKDIVYFFQALQNMAKEEKKASSGSGTTYRKDPNGFQKRSGAIRPGNNGQFSTFRKNENGFEEKTGSLRPTTRGRIDVFEKNKHGFEEATQK